MPCFERPDELEALLADLAATRRHVRSCDIDLEVVCVDNGSCPPISVVPPHGLTVRTVRLECNRGGSGGFNAGIAAALDRPEPDFLWLLDSDVRVERSTLRSLVRALDEHAGSWAVGPLLAAGPGEPPHEIGGHVDRRNGRMRGALPTPPDEPTPVDYVPSCCLLARRDVVQAHGLLPDVFLNGDDSEWCVRLSSLSGQTVLVDPGSVAYHPRFDRTPSWPRFYQSRNAFGVIAALKLGRTVVLRRAALEVGRAVNQSLLGRDDFARLHLRGLEAAACRRRIGPATPTCLVVEPPRPLGQLPPARGGSRPTSLLRRLLLGPPAAVAHVASKGGPRAWLQGRTMVVVDGSTGVLVRPHWPLGLARPVIAALRGAWLCARLALKPPQPVPLPTVEAERLRLFESVAPRAEVPLSIVVLSFNRKDVLRSTLGRLVRSPSTRHAEILVVDNGSRDGSDAMVACEFPMVTLLRQPTNSGVAAFNRGVEQAAGDVVLVLDDDAWPDEHSLDKALAWLRSHPRCAAVALHPRHPQTGRSEWPFAGRSSAPMRVDSAWPAMGCGNLVRRRDWLAAGGYEPAFFLYRNDVDLAMKLLSMGREVAFCERWIVWHDSPAAARKSARWFNAATRNWLWLARRHGSGTGKLAGALAGWAWAHRLAGLSVGRHAALLRGVLAGLFTPPPPLPGGAAPDGTAFSRLVELQLRSSARRGGAEPSIVTSTTGWAGGSEVKEPLVPGLAVEISSVVPANSPSSARHSA
ncbi:MAG: hypothetical protein GIKADHBN_00203 [Phycisphaerales bacterium]|nr:hypothetical protein [Phycisphaerales bacterium]